MKRLELKPNGFPCKLSECAPGFFLSGDTVGFKSEYGTDKGNSEAFCEGGCYFWGDQNKGGKADDTLVQPLVSEWVEE